MTERLPENRIPADFDLPSRKNGKDRYENVPTDPIKLMLAEARAPENGTYLTLEEEIELGKRIKNGMLFERKGDIIGAKKEDFNEDAREAMSQLMDAHQRLVVNIAKKYVGKGLPFEDLIQEGMYGMVIAARKYDYSLGNRFTTHATWWIEQSIRRAMANYSRIIRYPANVHDNLIKMNKMTVRQTLINGTEPTNEEIAQELGKPLKYVKKLKYAKNMVLDLDEPVGDKESVFADFIPDSKKNQEVIMEEKEYADYIVKMVNDIFYKNPRNATIFLYRVGYLDHEKHTLEETAKMFNLTRERVRQIEYHALLKIHNQLMRNEYFEERRMKRIR